MLEVIEEQQHLPLGQVSLNDLEERLPLIWTPLRGPEREAVREALGHGGLAQHDDLVVIPLPTEASAIEETLWDLDVQPDRLARARANNVANALRRHDWAYRWQTILSIAGLSESPLLRARIANLHSLAESAVGVVTQV